MHVPGFLSHNAIVFAASLPGLALSGANPTLAMTLSASGAIGAGVGFLWREAGQRIAEARDAARDAKQPVPSAHLAWGSAVALVARGGLDSVLQGIVPLTLGAGLVAFWFRLVAG